MSLRKKAAVVAAIGMIGLSIHSVFGFASQSEDYRISHQVIDLGGGRTTSENYTNFGSVGGSGGPNQNSEKYLGKPGFIGQIHDAPFVTVAEAEEVSRTSARFVGSVNPNSLESEAWFEYGPAGSFEEIFPLEDFENGTIGEAVFAIVSSFDPGTDYQFRLVASNLDGTVQSPAVRFSTEVNLPPEVEPFTLEVLRNLSAKVLVSELLGNASDPEGDSVDFAGAVSTSREGGTILVSNGWVLYQPPFEFGASDQFEYTIRDEFGAEAIGVVEVVLRGDGDEPTLNVRGIEEVPESGGDVRIRFVGVPGREYEIQATEDLSEWTKIGTAIADSVGLYEFIDEDAGNFDQRFYRAVRR